MTFNNVLATILVILIPALWVAHGYSMVKLPDSVIGALIATWTLVIQFYFRKAPHK